MFSNITVNVFIISFAMITPDTILFKSIITENINGNIIYQLLFYFNQTIQFFLKTLFSLESFP